MWALSSILLLFLSVAHCAAAGAVLAGGENYFTVTNTTSTVKVFWDDTAWSSDAVAGTTSASGRTFILTSPLSNRLSQATWISSFKVFLTNCTSTNAIKLKVFRPNAGAYDFVSETPGYSNLTQRATNTITLATPLLCREGDLCAMFWSGESTLGSSGFACKTRSLFTNYYTTSDITSSGWAPTLHIDNFRLCVEVYGSPANVGYVGDSIMAGHNAGADWRPILDNTVAGVGPIGGTPSSSIPFVCYQTNGLAALHLNASQGAQTFAWAVATGGPYVTNQQANIMVVEMGVNDVNTARTWADVAADLDSIRTMHARPKPLFILEITPWTAGDDTQAATIRTWNTNLAGWCSTNSATLVPMHDALGQIRISTGYLDDIATAYDQDGVHFKQAGVNLYATRLFDALRRVTQ